MKASIFIIFSVCSLAWADGPLKVFILAGQSNMEGHARIETFDFIGDDPASAPLLEEMRDADGQPRVAENAWISYFTGRGDENGEGFGKLTAGYGSRPNPAESGGKIGPEFVFGLKMDAALEEPILIIKTAWGGKSLFHDFRPPSAGPFERSEQDVEKGRHTPEKTGHYYRLMIEHVRSVLGNPKRVVPSYDVAQGYEIAGFIWFQGWNDMVNRGVYPEPQKGAKEPRYADYGKWMGDFIRDVRKDLEAPEMPFIIGVMGVGGVENEKQSSFRQAMAMPVTLPEFADNVRAVETAPFWSEELGAIDEKRGKVKQMGYYLRTKHKNHANKDGTMTPQEQRAFVQKFEAELITADERAMWERGASNAGYHYLGCAKTFALMGDAYAKTMLELMP